MTLEKNKSLEQTPSLRHFLGLYSLDKYLTMKQAL